MLLSVFTPTYNRRELLTRTYESLKRQTVHDFKWIIVDDGSSDDTDEYVKSWIDEGIVSIEYKYVENGGKMRAHNVGAAMCETELFLCLDSDDYLVDDAVELIEREWEKAVAGYPENSFKKLGGIVAHKGRSNTELLSDCDFPIDGYTGLYELYLNGFKGETTLVFVTKALLEHPFPEIDGEKYVPEDYIYDKIDKEYVLKTCPAIITVCEIVEEGYTSSVKKLKINNPIAWYLYYEQRAVITPASVLKIKYAGYYVIYCGRTKNKLIHKGGPKVLWVILGIMAALVLKLTGRE